MVEEDESGTMRIYDDPPGGISLVLEVVQGVDLVFHLSDDHVEWMIKVMQNKLNGHYKEE